MTEKNVSMPPKSITCKIGINKYEIPFPKNGQLIDIEVKKMASSQGMHRELMMGLPSATHAAVLIDAHCTFSVLLPQLTKDLNVGSIMDLDLTNSQDIMNAYEQYYDWMSSWRTYLSGISEKKKEGKGATE